ncbi:SHOCT domain-containing protein [Lacrimispora sp. 38-1]|uniref:SHOCT domain-containing protein n=1 Tax=Lacrimispora sp. 38-1 TaxID=3125778 RepID=UPI003CE9EAEC
MKKGIKILISFILAIIFVIIFIINNFALRIKYEIPTKKTANLYYHVNTLENDDVHYSKMKYLFTTYNEKSNIYRVNYYALIDGKENEWLIIETDLNGSDMQIANMDVYERTSETSIKVYKNNFTSITDFDGTWVKLDKTKLQNLINCLLVMILFAVLILFIYLKRDTIHTVLAEVSNKEKSNNINRDSSPALGQEGNNINLEKLKELSIMKEKGYITEEEFQNKKKDIIDKM